MLKMKRIILIQAILILSGYITLGQNEVDALRYSFIIPGGSARFTGIAGAFNAVGADLSTMNTNPAGIGLFKSSEFTFSGSVFTSATNTSYMNQTRSDDNSNFNIPNVGFVYNIPINSDPEDFGVRNIQLGFGLVRNNNYHNRIAMEGTNPDNSLLDAYVDWANGHDSDDLGPFDTDLAYQTYLIDPIPNTLYYTNRAPLYPNGSIAPVNQQKNILTEGFLNEFDISIGTNISDMLYLGVSAGLPYLRYYEESHYAETNTITNDTNTFDRFTKTDWLETEGNGYNFKFGLIYRPADLIRIGVAYHTPTWFNHMYDEYSSSMNSYLNNGKDHFYSSPLGAYDYKLETPWRAIGSLTIFFKQHGLISVDYEYVDYSSAELKGNSYDYYDTNEQIRMIYQSASNIRVGTEWRYGHLAVRGGYGYYESPYENEINDGTRQVIAAGIGYRSNSFYLDFGYNHIKYTEDYYLYSSETTQAPPAEVDTQQNNFVFTFGMKY